MKNQKGFTLVEMMIAGFIGTFVIAGLINLFITTNRTVTLSDSLAKNQETGRFAMDYMTTFIRRAGYTEDATNEVAPLFITTADLSINCADANQANACALNNPENMDILGDRLSIPYNVGGTDDDQLRSCTGTLIGGTVNGAQRVVDVFWVSDASNSKRELRCRTFNRDTNDWLGAPVSLINNVERMEFQLGISNEEADPHVSQYVSVNTLVDDPVRSVNHIRSIRLSILTTSQKNSADNTLNADKQSRTYGLLDAPVFSINDGNLRNIFNNTIELPNMINGAGI